MSTQRIDGDARRGALGAQSAQASPSATGSDSGDTAKVLTARGRLAAIEYDGDAQVNLGLHGVQQLRRAAFREHVAALSEPTRDDGFTLSQWVGQMTAKYGAAVKVHHNVLPWDVALFVIRYGENPEHWPTALSDADVARAGHYLERQSELGSGVVVLGDRRTPAYPSETLLGVDELEG
jgi:hypothetical protein